VHRAPFVRRAFGSWQPGFSQRAWLFWLLPRASYPVRTAIPAALTLGNALCGFAGIIVLSVSGVHGIAFAAMLIFVAWVFDVCDGPLARRLQADRSFGAVLDSVCDAVSFGVLPAMLVVTACRETHAAWAIAVASAYLAAALLRLARYTVKALGASSEGIRWWFSGLPSPVAAMSVGAVALWNPSPWDLVTVAAVGAPLMISPLPYADMVQVYARRRLPAWTLLLPLVAAVVFNWSLVLVVALAAYLASGAVVALTRRNATIVTP
jgi:CDP-diacylglycerol---serine O-phosphatidyltransferase